MHVMNVTVIAPADTTEMKKQYAKAIARMIEKRLPPEYIDEVIKRLKEVR